MPPPFLSSAFLTMSDIVGSTKGKLSRLVLYTGSISTSDRS